MQSAIWNLGIVCLRSIYCYNCAVIGGMCSRLRRRNVQFKLLVECAVGYGGGYGGHGRSWKVMEGHGMSWKVIECH